MLSHLYRLWQIAFCKPVQQQKCRRCRFDVRSFNSSHDCCVLFCFRQSVVCKSLPAPNKLHTVRVYEMRSEREEMHKNLNPSLKAALTTSGGACPPEVLEDTHLALYPDALGGLSGPFDPFPEICDHPLENWLNTLTPPTSFKALSP